jgi:predicted permease
VRAVLRLFPRDFRAESGEELLDMVRAEREVAERMGGWASFRFGVHVTLDLIRAALRLHARRPQSVAGSAAPARSAALSERRGSGTSGARAFARELKHAWRRLAAAPGFTVVVVLSLALGIGANSAVFSVVDAVLLEPLEYRESERLVQIEARWETTGIDNTQFSGGELKRIRDEARSFDEIAAVGRIRQNLVGSDVPRQVQVGWVTTNLFTMLGVEAAVGRVFAADDPPGTALLDHELWRTGFGADRDIVGRTIRLDGYTYTVVGVLPPGFRLLLPGVEDHLDVWKVPDDWWQNGDVWSATGAAYGSFRLLGRLGEGVGIDAASAEMARFADELRRVVPGYEDVGFRIGVVPLHERVVRDVRPLLLLLFAAVGCVLAIACANVVNLMLVRTQARSREIALRRALGSGRAGIVRLLLAESLLLALLGGGAGLLLARIGVRALSVAGAPDIPRLEEAGIDLPVLGFAAAAALLCTVAFGLIPALLASRTAGVAHVSPERVGAGGGRASRTLVTVQLALAAVLLVSAALLAKSVARLASVDAGFDADDVLAFSVSLPGKRYERPHGTDRFLRELEQRIEALPGVRSAGVVWPLPLSGRKWSDDYTGGRVVDGSGRSLAEYRLATEGYFETMGVRLLEGRTFGATDRREVAIVSRTLAERAWPGESAVGRTVYANPWGGGDSGFEVIGVIEDVRNADLREPPGETLYFDSRGWSWTDWEVDVVVRADGEVALIVPSIRAILLDMDSEIPLANPRSMQDYVLDAMSSTRFATLLASLFAAIAGALAVIGLYGVVSYWVARRTRELGIRIALGSGRRALVMLVVGQGALVIAGGLAFGLAAAFAHTHLLHALLFGVQPDDGGTFAAVAVALAAVSLVACYLPARRATRLDPLAVMRAD